MQQGQENILIARFPDPNYGVKMVNFIITPLTYRELSVSSYLRYFKNKVKGNIWGQIPLSKHKGLRGILGSTENKHLFEIPITPMWPGFSECHKNNLKVIKI